MDKYDLVLDIIEHPEKYSADQLKELMADAETREIYTLLCKTDAAARFQKTFDAETGWKEFTARHRSSFRRRLRWSENRAASIAAITGISVVTFAAGLVLVVALSKPHPEQPGRPGEMPVVDTSAVIKDTIAQPLDSIAVPTEPIMFENTSLEEILKEVHRSIMSRSNLRIKTQPASISITSSTRHFPSTKS